MNIMDAVIILFLLLGAVLGFKAGVIKSGVTFIGTLIVIVLAFILKNPLSTVLYTYLPFFRFGGLFKGVSLLNILIYEAISFLIVFVVLYAILRVLIIATGILEKVLKFTIVLGIPSKILGAIFGALSMFVVLFVCLFAFTQFNFSYEVTEGSKYTWKILESTPLLSNYVSSGFKSVKEIYSLTDMYKTDADEENVALNLKALEILLKNEVLSPSNARALIENGKLSTPGAEDVIRGYEND